MRVLCRGDTPAAGLHGAPEIHIWTLRRTGYERVFGTST